MGTTNSTPFCRGLSRPIGFYFCLFLIFAVGLPTVAEGQAVISEAGKKKIVYMMYAEYRNEFSGVREIFPQTAMKRMKEEKVIFVDVRDDDEMSISALPDSVSEAQFLKDIRKYSKYRIIAYCTIGYRSGKMAEKMAEKGKVIYNLRGGILAWTLEGGKLYGRDGKETKKVHVYGKKWNYPARGYEAVW